MIGGAGTPNATTLAGLQRPLPPPLPHAANARACAVLSHEGNPPSRPLRLSFTPVLFVGACAFLRTRRSYKVFINVAQDTSHLIQVRAVNLLGAGPWTDPFACSTEPARAPGQPSAPTEAAITAASDSPITMEAISMSPPTSIGLDVLEYKVYVDGEERATTQNLYYVVRGLQPETTHTYAYQARNDVGWSPMSPVVTLSTGKAIPPYAPSNFEQLSLPNKYYPATALYIKWDLGIGIDNWARTGSHVRQYALEYCRQGVTSSCQTLGLTSSDTVLSNLEPETTYTIRAMTVATNGYQSSWSAPAATFTTSEALLPTAPPTGPWQSDPSFLNNATGIYVVWEAANGLGLPILQYRVQVDQEIGSDTWRYLGAMTAYLHDGLMPQESHTYVVAARNAVGWGLTTNPQTLSTASGRPPRTPTRVRLAEADPLMDNVTAMEIAWDTPESDVPVSGYHIEWTGRSYLGVEETRTFHSPRNNIRVFDMEPGASASVKVRAQSPIGISSWSTLVTLTAEQPRPPRVPFNVRKGSILSGFAPSTQASIAWDHFHEDAYGLPLLRTRILANAGTANEINRYLVCPCSSQYTLLDLVPLSTYSVQVAVETSLGWSPISDAITIDVPDAEPPGPLRGLFNGGFLSNTPASTHVVVGWVPARPTGLDLTQYKIYIDEGTDAARVQTINCPCGTTFSLFDLGPAETHTFAIESSNARGWGPKVGTIALNTSEGSPPRAITELRRGSPLPRISNVNTFTLVWTPPIPDGLELTENQLKITAVATGVEVRLSLSATRASYIYRCYNGADHESFVASGCAEKTSYTFQIRATNSKGNGAWSTPVTLTTAAMRAPKAAVRAVQVRDMNDPWRDPTHLAVFWAEPDDDGTPIDNYEICFETVNSSGEPLTSPNAMLDPERMPTGCASHSCCYETGKPVLGVDMQLVGESNVPQIHYRLVKFRAHNAAGWAPAYSPPALLHTKFPERPMKMHSLLSAPHLIRGNHRYTLCRNIAVQWEYGRSPALYVLSYEIMVDEDSSSIVSTSPEIRAGWLGPYDFGSNHSFRIRATNALGPGLWSDPLILSTAPIAIAPRIDAPHKKTIIGVDATTHIPVSWYGRDLCDSANLAGLMVDDEYIEGPHRIGCGNSNIHMLSNVLPGTRHTFKVRIRNVIGWGEWSDLAEYWTDSTVPAIPEPCETLSLNSSMAVLAFTVPYHNGKPIDKMRLQVSLGDYESYHDFDAADYNLTDTARIVHAVSRVSFNTSESYRISAHNELGWGEFSRANIIGGKVTFEPAAPAVPKVSGLSQATEFTVSFQLPSTSANPQAAGHFFPISEFQLTVRPVGGNLELHSLGKAILATLCNGGVCQYTFSGLSPATQYEVRASALSEGGRSAESTPLLASTIAAVPSPARGISVQIHQDSPAFTIQWSPASGNGAAISHYTIEVCEASNGVPSEGAESNICGQPTCTPEVLNTVAGTFTCRQRIEWLSYSYSAATACSLVAGEYAAQCGPCAFQWALCQTVVAAGSATQATVSGLSPGRNYTVGIDATNAVGSSGKSTAFGTHTTFDVPMKGWQPARSIALGTLDAKTDIHVVWAAPYANGDQIVAYELEIDGKVTTRLADVNVQQYIVTGLHPGTSHVFRVAATNSRGRGPFS